ncbi:MAG: response regulator [Isosphaeraceae bacterium]
MSAVLIVDDSPSDRALLRTILARAGLVVHELAHGRDALARAREVRPHAIVLDVNLADTDGHSVCRELKADPEVSGIPVLMLTVRDNDDDVIAGLEAGADDYVAKDSAPAIVLARVRRLIQFRQLATVAVLNENLIQVGRLLAGIVHEIRSPLAVILGSAELMRLQLSQGDPNLSYVEPILRSAQLLQVRLEHLMATVRGGASTTRVVDIEPLVREASELFHKGTDPRGCVLAIERSTLGPLPKVNLDGGRFIQVLLALLGNAQEAVAGCGRKTGKVGIVTGTARDEEGEWVTVQITDDGPGIPETCLGRIFEPFFTTKEKGTGFGLYLACEVLREQGGKLSAENLAGQGARFTIRLPAAGCEPMPTVA